MAASTITRDTWTDDTGTPAAPNADGTLINNSVLQNHIYARIDAMFAGAGAYVTFTVGGRIAAEGFGTHSFSAGGAGENRILLRNTNAGTGNFAGVNVQADGASVVALQQFSTTFTTSGSAVADGGLVIGTGAGGLNLSAAHASGVLRFFTASGEAMRVSALKLLIGDTSDADVTRGITINQGLATDRVLTFKNTSVAHGMTAGGVFAAETDTFASFGIENATLGGLRISAYSEAVTTVNAVMRFNAAAVSGSGDTTKTTTSVGYFGFYGLEHSAGTFIGVGANENLLIVNDGNFTRFILDSDGDSHQDVGTAWTNFDDHDDIALLHALSAGVSRPGDPLRAHFAEVLEAHRETLERNRIVAFNPNGHHFINWSRAHMLTIGAVRQLGMQLATMQATLRALEA